MRTVICSIRRKLGEDPEDLTYIFTELRVGYRMPESQTPGRRAKRSSEPCVPPPWRPTMVGPKGCGSQVSQPHLEDGAITRPRLPCQKAEKDQATRQVWLGDYMLLARFNVEFR